MKKKKYKKATNIAITLHALIRSAKKSNDCSYTRLHKFTNGGVMLTEHVRYDDRQISD